MRHRIKDRVLSLRIWKLFLASAMIGVGSGLAAVAFYECSTLPQTASRDARRSQEEGYLPRGSD